MTDKNTKILIIGAGATGLCLALGLASRNIASVVIGKPDRRITGRTTALFEGSLRLLRNLGLWDDCAPLAAPLSTMRIIDDTGSFFRPPPASFKARELGLDAFGANIENRILVDILCQHAHRSDLVTFHENWVTEFSTMDAEVSVVLDSGARLSAEILVGADGYKSPARHAAGIDTRNWDYPQMALTCILAHQRPHYEISTEFHTRQGPFTFVPLTGVASAHHRSSLVWLTDKANAARLQKQSSSVLAETIEIQGHSFLGKISLLTDAHIFPMRGMVAKTLGARRIALIGEAAHAFPPIGAQGLNLGLRDVAHLVDILESASSGHRDMGSNETLALYDRSRSSDIALRVQGVDMLNKSLLAPYLPMDILRGAGLLALEALPFLRKSIMRTGLMPQGTPPRLMQPIA
jgi:2-octaprenyl-6-methoxyphenol hydroxylase